MTVVWVAVIVAIGACVQLVLNGRQTRQAKRQDWDRQDQVAARAAAASQAQADRAAETAHLLLESNKEVADTLTTANETVTTKLDVIHSLVNSSMTAAMQSELDAVRREAAMMQEVIELKRAAGQEPGTEALAELAATAIKIGELQAKLTDRLTEP